MASDRVGKRGSDMLHAAVRIVTWYILGLLLQEIVGACFTRLGNADWIAFEAFVIPLARERR